MVEFWLQLGLATNACAVCALARAPCTMHSPCLLRAPATVAACAPRRQQGSLSMLGSRAGGQSCKSLEHCVQAASRTAPGRPLGSGLHQQIWMLPVPPITYVRQHAAIGPCARSCEARHRGSQHRLLVQLTVCVLEFSSRGLRICWLCMMSAQFCLGLQGSLASPSSCPCVVASSGAQWPGYLVWPSGQAPSIGRPGYPGHWATPRHSRARMLSHDRGAAANMPATDTRHASPSLACRRYGPNCGCGPDARVPGPRACPLGQGPRPDTAGPRHSRAPIGAAEHALIQASWSRSKRRSGGAAAGR